MAYPSNPISDTYFTWDGVHDAQSEYLLDGQRSYFEPIHVCGNLFHDTFQLLTNIFVYAAFLISAGNTATMATTWTRFRLADLRRSFHCR